MKVPTQKDRLAARERPAGSPVMFQTWEDLLFLHWEIDPAEIRARIPEGLEVEIFPLRKVRTTG